MGCFLSKSSFFSETNLNLHPELFFFAWSLSQPFYYCHIYYPPTYYLSYVYHLHLHLLTPNIFHFHISIYSNSPIFTYSSPVFPYFHIFILLYFTFPFVTFTLFSIGFIFPLFSNQSEGVWMTFKPLLAAIITGLKCLTPQIIESALLLKNSSLC